MDGRPYPAVVNVGVRPTFGETTVAVEAHLLDFSGDLYGRRVRLDFLERLREEMRFPSVDDLKAQIMPRHRLGPGAVLTGVTLLPVTP